MTDQQLPGSVRKRRGRDDRRTNRRTLKIIAAGIAAAVLLGVAAGFVWLKSLENQMQLKPHVAAKVKKVTKEPEGTAINIVLAGTDLRPASKGSRTDTVIFIRADKASKKVYVLSIPRDSRVEIPGRGLDKINHAWPFGGAPLLIKTVSNFLDMPVNYFFQVDFSRFEKTVNALGGVDFDSKYSWYDGELGVAVRAGMQHRSGREALALVRNRHHGAGGGGDLVRVPIQQEFLTAMISQSIKSYTDVPRVATVVAQQVNTNMSMTDMLGSGRSFAGAGMQMETAILPGKSGMYRGVSYVFPDEKAKEALVSAMLKNQPFPK